VWSTPGFKQAPRYYGNSVGRYVGDTAVIDTIGLKPWGLDDGGPVADGNHMFTIAAHFIERYRRTGPTTMSYTLTIDDPNIFTKPFTCGAKDSHCLVEETRGRRSGSWACTRSGKLLNSIVKRTIKIRACSSFWRTSNSAVTG
jgi:hypothetical protein